MDGTGGDDAGAPVAGEAAAAGATAIGADCEAAFLTTADAAGRAAFRTLDTQHDGVQHGIPGFALAARVPNLPRPLRPLLLLRHRVVAEPRVRDHPPLACVRRGRERVSGVSGRLPVVRAAGSNATTRVPRARLLLSPPSRYVGAAMSAAEPWEHTLTRRLRSLVRTGPVHRIEASKASRARDLSLHDLRGLALRVIDAAIEHMGLGYGARRADLHDALAPLIRAAEPEIAPADVAEIGDAVIDALLNEPNRRRAFDERYLSYEGGGAVARAVSFHLLREEEADDGSIVLKATTEAINLYAGMLEIDVEDAQTAAEAVLAAQLARGAIGAAVATARQARHRSIEYGEKIRQTLRRARRDVSQVDPKEMLATIAAGRRHLGERLEVERGLLDTVAERVGEAEATDVAALVELRSALEDCRQRHLVLHEHLLGANQIWLREQERQRFRRGRTSALPDLEKDVLQALIAEPRGVVEPLVDALLLPLHAPAPPPVMGLSPLVDALLAPRRAIGEDDLASPVDTLVDIRATETRFDATTRARVDALVALGGTLGALLGRSRSEEDPPEVRRLLVLRALWAWDPDGGDPLAVRPAGALADPEYEGEDLHLGVR